MNTKVHNLYNTESECLASVYDMFAINLDLLPDDKWIKAEIAKAENLSKSRMEKLYTLYKEKIEYIRYLQSQQCIYK